MLTPVTLAESAGQAAMRVVRDEVDTDHPVTGQTISLVAARASAARATIVRAVAIKRKAPDLIPGVVNGAMPLNAAYEIARQRRPIDRTKAGRQARYERIREMANEGYTDQDIADAVRMNVESVRNLMNQRLGIKTMSSKMGMTRRLDADRIMERMVTAAEPPLDALTIIDWDALDRDQLQDWEHRLSAAIHQWTSVRNKLRRLHAHLEW